jgi:acetyl esterase
VLVYPVTDADMGRPSYSHPDNQQMLTRESMVYFWDHYVPHLPDRSHPDASPLRESNLAGLPPAVLFTAEYDPLRDEGEAYAVRLLEAGVSVQFCRFLGQIHGFFAMVNVLPASDRAIDQVARAIDAQLALLAS